MARASTLYAEPDRESGRDSVVHALACTPVFMLHARDALARASPQTIAWSYMCGIKKEKWVGSAQLRLIRSIECSVATAAGHGKLYSSMHCVDVTKSHSR